MRERLLRTCNPQLILYYLEKVLIMVYRQTEIEVSESVRERERERERERGCLQNVTCTRHND